MDNIPQIVSSIVEHCTGWCDEFNFSPKIEREERRQTDWDLQDDNLNYIMNHLVNEYLGCGLRMIEGYLCFNNQNRMRKSHYEKILYIVL